MLAAVSLIVLLTQIGPMIGLIVALAVLWFAFRRFVRADTTGSKVLWIIIGLIALFVSIGHIPALIGFAALLGLYYAWKKWKNTSNKKKETDDPFHNFDKQWNELM
jgi:lia operon protein LiaI